MTKAFVDTTILTNALLKPSSNQPTKALLKKYSETQLPVYAIKEFKAGPLQTFAWFHDKLVLLGSFEKALKVLHGVSRSPRRYRTSTAIESIIEVVNATSRTPMSKLINTYGDSANLGSITTDCYRLAIKSLVYKAWKKRRKLTTLVVQDLDCYEEVDLVENRGLIDLRQLKCKVKTECCLADKLRSDPAKLKLLCDAVKDQPSKRENQKRGQILTDLLRKPKLQITEQMCRDLGDAIIVYFAPDDSVILTTNIIDHNDLAKALGKSVESP